MGETRGRRPEEGGVRHHQTVSPPQEYERKPTRSLTQGERVLRLIEDWCCGLGFLDPSDGGPPILRYTGRLFELRRAGYRIDRRPCQAHDHGPTTQMWEWRLVGVPQPVNEGAPCKGCGSRLSHTSDCPVRKVAKTEGQFVFDEAT